MDESFGSIDMDGRNVFADLSGHDEEYRGCCVFPGYFSPEEYAIIREEFARDASIPDDVKRELAGQTDYSVAMKADQAFRDSDVLFMWHKMCEAVRDIVRKRMLREARFAVWHRRGTDAEG